MCRILSGFDKTLLPNNAHASDRREVIYWDQEVFAAGDGQRYVLTQLPNKHEVLKAS